MHQLLAMPVHIPRKLWGHNNSLTVFLFVVKIKKNTRLKEKWESPSIQENKLQAEFLP